MFEHLRACTCVSLIVQVSICYMCVPCVLVSVQGHICYRRMYLVVCKGKHMGFLLCVCICVCECVRKSQCCTCVVVCRCVNLEGMCLSCESIYASLLVSQSEVVYVQTYMCRIVCTHMPVSLAQD